MGNFSFENVAFGTYKLYTEVTGFYGEPITITIDQANPAFYNAMLEIYESPPYGIQLKIVSSGFQSGPVYPNPLTDQLNLEVVVDKDLLLNASIYNLLGQKVFEDQLLMFTGKTTLTLSTDRLDRGLYFITIRSDEVRTQNTYKFLKK